MNIVRRGYELRWLFLGRTIRPFHMATAIATGAIAVAGLWFGGIVFDGHAAQVAGIWSAIACGLLTYGWWGRSNRAAEWGLLLATGIWCARMMYGLFDVTETPTGWFGVTLSLAWTVAAGGAYLLERYDNETGGGAGE